MLVSSRIDDADYAAEIPECLIHVPWNCDLVPSIGEWLRYAASQSRNYPLFCADVILWLDGITDKWRPTHASEAITKHLGTRHHQSPFNASLRIFSHRSGCFAPNNALLSIALKAK
jgi:hypothetical protein